MTIRSTLRGASLAATLFASLASCNGELSPAKDGTCNLGSNTAQLSNVVTSLAFNSSVLTGLGVTVQSTATAKPAPQHALSLLPGPVSSFGSTSECMGLDVKAGHLEDFTSGRIVHSGGPVLKVGGETLNLAGFEVRVGDEPRTFDLYTSSGEHVLRGKLPHYQIDAATSTLDVFNVDLAATSLLASRWKMPNLDGMVLGTLTMRGTVKQPALSASQSALSDGKPDGNEPANACDNFSGQVDVALTAMDAVQQQGRVGDKVIITPSAILKNVGTANVPWQAKFSPPAPPYNTDQHPFLVWALYRESNGIFEMLANSDVKHAFLTINSNCNPGSCTISSVLGLGCEDVYGVGTNGAHLAPRSEILPKAGTWAHCNFPAANTPSHFDQAAPWCAQDNNGSSESTLTHRLVASDAELSVAGASYYFASWYVVRDDINIFNNMGWRRITPSLSGTTWSFGFPSAYRNGSALDAWVDPAVSVPNKLNVMYKDAVSGNAQLAVTVTDLGNGQFRYVYALQNHDYDPKLSSFTIPVTQGAAITQAKFSDGDDDPTNDWVTDVGIGQVQWAAASAATQLSWGRMLTFSFIANIAPLRGQVTLTRGDTGAGFKLKSFAVGGNILR
jgi:hypothetical protein